MLINVIGLDPSFRNWGIAKGIYDTNSNTLTINKTHIITTKPSKANIKQNTKDLISARTLYIELCEHLEGSEVVIAEVPHGSQSARAMVSYGVCIGVLASALQDNCIFIQVSANDVKRLVGSKDASKDEVIEWVKQHQPETNNLMPKTKKAEHIADAVVAMRVGLQSKKFKEFINENSTK